MLRQKLLSVRRIYMVKASAVSSNPTQTASGTITLEPSGEQPYGTEVRIASAEGQNGARLLTILANGKEISQNDVLTVTGDLTVTAVFDPSGKYQERHTSFGRIKNTTTVAYPATSCLSLRRPMRASLSMYRI